MYGFGGRHREKGESVSPLRLGAAGASLNGVRAQVGHRLQASPRKRLVDSGMCQRERGGGRERERQEQKVKIAHDAEYECKRDGIEMNNQMIT